MSRVDLSGELPIVTKAKQLKLAESTAKEPQRVSKARILVVDDDMIVQQFLTEVLGEEGYEVGIVDNGNDVREELGREDYDVILLDIKMPGISGIELYQRLEEIMPTLAKRVIFITGDTIGVDTREFLSSTEAHCIAKPFNTTQLRESIRYVLTDND